VVYLSDTPYFATAPAECAAEYPDQLQRCSQPPADVFAANIDGALEAAATASGARYLDLRPLLCTESECGAVIGDVLLYRDHDHLTNTFAQLIAPRVQDLVLGRTPDNVPTGSNAATMESN